jgi:dTDP-4-dehydrorhamnose 3,5-epimerase
MKIIEIKTLAIPDIKVIRYGRFCDNRGYFSEQLRKSDIHSHPQMNFLKSFDFMQANESYSKAGVVRGLHFQWNPYMGKLVRTIRGRMVDIVMDIRKGSPTLGKAIMYDMLSTTELDYCDWIWVPPGFAHGNYFTENTIIEYLCTSEYSPGCEGGVSPLSKDLDWSLSELGLKAEFDKIISGNLLISEKDKIAPNLNEWLNDKRSDNFIYQKL